MEKRNIHILPTLILKHTKIASSFIIFSLYMTIASWAQVAPDLAVTMVSSPSSGVQEEDKRGVFIRDYNHTFCRHC